MKVARYSREGDLVWNHAHETASTLCRVPDRIGGQSFCGQDLDQTVSDEYCCQGTRLGRECRCLGMVVVWVWVRTSYETRLGTGRCQFRGRALESVVSMRGMGGY